MRGDLLKVRKAVCAHSCSIRMSCVCVCTYLIPVALVSSTWSPTPSQPVYYIFSLPSIDHCLIHI